jgi:hypothetical protein
MAMRAAEEGSNGAEFGARMRATGGRLLLLGGAGCAVGVVGLVRLFHRLASGQPIGRRLSYAVALAWPHVLAVTGFGFAVFGAVLVLRARALRLSMGTSRGGLRADSGGDGG